VIAPARQVAFDVLLRVAKDAKFASDELRLQSVKLDARDAGLASEIVFGCLRYQAQLDFLIEHFAGKSAALDLEVRIALWMGIFQLRYLDRVPPHAAVMESVELTKRAKKLSASGFVNAVLRKVTRAPVRWPNAETELSVPAWMLSRWKRFHGAEAAKGIALNALTKPESYIRVPTGGSVEGLDVEATDVEGCWRVREAVTTFFRRQDIGSQAVVPLLELKDGMTFLDLCAAPGNKTAQAMETNVQVVAADREWRRLRSLDDLAVDRVVLDATEPLPFSRKFDRILIDAPCSGTGTLARNPEIKWRLQQDDLARYQDRQRRLVTRGMEALAPGGILVYSTCSLEPEENRDVVDTFARPEKPGARPRAGMLTYKLMERIPGRDPGDGFFAAVIRGV
jgi:16S rRNA (cytosine967-C5)-methyltransferase